MKTWIRIINPFRLKARFLKEAFWMNFVVSAFLLIFIGGLSLSLGPRMEQLSKKIGIENDRFKTIDVSKVDPQKLKGYMIHDADSLQDLFQKTAISIYWTAALLAVVVFVLLSNILFLGTANQELLKDRIAKD